MTRKSRKKIIAYGLETTYGTDVLTGGNAQYVLGRDFSITPMAGESSALDYDDGTLGNSGEIVTELYVTVEFTVDFASSGSATAVAPWGDLMKACLRKVTSKTQGHDGADETLYEIDDESTESLTLYYYQSGVLHKVTGARGSLSLSVKAKSFAGIKFTFTGLHGVVSSQEVPSGSFSKWQTPLKVGVENSACTLDGKSIKMISLDYDQSNQVVYQEYVGHEEVAITDFKPTGTLVIEAPSLSTIDVFALAKAGAEHALIFTNGPKGNQVEWSSAKVQLGRPTYGDQDGTQTYSIPLRIIGDSDKFATR